MGELILTNARLITPFEEIFPGTIEVKDGVIKKVYKGKNPKGENLEERIVSPGFIDIHTHGIGGFDITQSAMELSEEKVVNTLFEMSKKYINHGVTYFLPTTVTAPHEALLVAASGVKKAIENQDSFEGARIGGLHLEGPYINKEKKGAQNPQFIRPPSISELKEYWEASGGNIKTITIAPEVRGAIEFIHYAKALDISISLGHTNATYEEAKLAIYAGANRATHLYNGMRTIHHREPGIVIASLESPQVYLELICDLIHVSPQMLKFTIKVAGTDRIVVITDSIIATDLSDGEYTLGGLEVVVKDGICRLKNGGLAGSTLTMDDALKNLVNIGIPLRDALRMMTYNPAMVVGINKLGAILPGYLADLVVLDENLSVERVYLGGNIVEM